MRRLYIGGLSHSVSQKDLKDRLGKFGVVEDVELRTRKDDDGVPYKTFGYVNINISDADLKKCLTVLNKSKWKGGTLQIEPAKESFLHRLAEERQAVEKQLQQPAVEDKRTKLLDSLSRAGVDNFTMKAAVPGTEIPGHKDWVVSKYGRVLPIMQLRCKKGNKTRTLKHDPSKYSHNIRRLNPPITEQPTPVTQLTWHVEGGDDDISKKRRGEFPPYEPPRPKRSRADGLRYHNILDSTRSEPHSTKPHLTNGFEGPFDSRPPGSRGAYLVNSDIDSDEEIHRLVAVEKSFPGGLRQDVQDDDLEVVGLDYLVKSGSSSLHQRGRQADEDDYDSADTDELFSCKKRPLAQEKRAQPCAGSPSGSNTEKKRKTKKKYETAEEEEEKSKEEARDSRKPAFTQLKINSAKKHGRGSEDQQTKIAVLPVTKPYSSESVRAEDNEDLCDEKSESADSESDYEAMFSNVTHLEISLADLQRVAEEFQQTTESTAPSILSNAVNGTAKHIPKKGTTPEEILSSILEGDSSEDEKKTKKRKKAKERMQFPAFQGTRALDEETGKEACQRTQNKEEEKGSPCKAQTLTHDAPQINSLEGDGRKDRMKPAENRSTSREDEEEIKEEMVKCTRAPEDSKANLNKPESSSSSSSDEDEEEEEEVMGNQTAAKTTPSSSAVKEFESLSRDKEEVEWLKQEGIVMASPRVPRGAKEEEELQKKANKRRLAAVQQRQKEAEEHKRLIQGALANLDTTAARTGKHVVFESDDDEDEDQQPVSSQIPDLAKTLPQDSRSEDKTAGGQSAVSENESSKEKAQVNPSGPQLFLSSEDEEDGHEEGDGSRFEIRPQFEGQAGQKLMELQSRFGIDKRFRMDSRFLEEDDDRETSENTTGPTEEEALEEERKKNLLILQSVLGSSQQTCSSNTTRKAKTFRDISALHYDPSREEHSAFETKTDDSKKESKSARRKKKEEAQKLPEVSKELYYNVSENLKAMFGGANDEKVEEEEKTSWDKEEEEDREEKEEEQQQPPLLFSEPVADREELSGFQFSFFGNDVKTGHGDTEDYKVESIQAPKVLWQQDPRLQESSSEEEEQEEDEEKVTSALKTTDEETPSKGELFFFFPDDSRLTEGPRLFCRSSQLEEQREEWEERRTALRQDFRKKHRDARRKLKPAQRS